MSQAKGAERRVHIRAPIGIIVRLESADDSRRYYSKDVSAGGVFLLAEDPLPTETKVRVELFLPLISAPVRAQGEVVWVQRQDPAGFAVRFTDISDGARDLIRYVVNRYMGVPGEKT